MTQATITHFRSILALALLLAVPAGATARVRNRTGVEIWIMPSHGAGVRVPDGGYADLEPAPCCIEGSPDAAPVKGARFLVMAANPRHGCRIDCALVLPGPGPDGGLAPCPHDAHPANLGPAPDETGPDSHPIRVWDFHGRAVAAGGPAAPSAPDGMASWRPESLSPGLGGGAGGRFSPLPMPALSPSQASHARVVVRSVAGSPVTVKRHFKTPPFLALDREGRRIPDLAALAGVTDLRGMTFMPHADLSTLDIASVDLHGADLSETMTLASTQVPLLRDRGLLPAEGDVFNSSEGFEHPLPDLGPVVEWCRDYKRLMAYFGHTGKLDPRPISDFVWEEGLADWKRAQHTQRDQLKPWQKELLAFIEGMTEYVDTGQTPPAPARRPSSTPGRGGQASPADGHRSPSGKAGSRPATPRRGKRMDPEDKSWSRSTPGRVRPRTPVKRKLADTADRAESPSPTKHPRTPTRPGNPPASLTPPPAWPKGRSAAASRHPRTPTRAGNPPSSLTPPPAWPQARSAAAPTAPPVLPAPPASAATVPMAPRPVPTRVWSARNLFGAGWNPPGPMLAGSAAESGQAAPTAGLEVAFQGFQGPTHFRGQTSLSRPASPQALALAPDRTGWPILWPLASSPGLRPLSPPGLPSLGGLGHRPLSPEGASRILLERPLAPFPIEPSSPIPDAHPFDPQSLAPAAGAEADDGSEEGFLPLQCVALWPEFPAAGGEEGD